MMQQNNTPPIANQILHEGIRHGDAWVDPYYWLRERDNPAVTTYIEAENAYTEAIMAHTKPLQETLYQEMIGRIQETDIDVPEKLGDFLYYTRTEAGQEYPIYCRIHDDLTADEQVLLDQNQIAAGFDYCRVGVFEVSPNQRLLAYSVDTDGSEVYTLYIKDLETGELLADQIPDTYYSVVWANDNQTLFYNVVDEAKRPFKLFRHTVGTSITNDQLIYHEQDEAFFLWCGKSRSEQYIMLALTSNDTAEEHILAADSPTAEFQVVQPRRKGIEYTIYHHGRQLYMMTNEDAQNFKLLTGEVTQLGQGVWQEVIPHRPSVKLNQVLFFADYMVVYEREQGLNQACITNLQTDETHYITFPESVYHFWFKGNREFETTTLRFYYSSLTTPESVFDYDMNAQSRELRKQKPVLGGYDPAQYQAERIFAQASDGTQVPISFVYKKGLKRDGQNPCFLIGYGSYGYSIDPTFSTNRLSLLNRGFVYAIAHIRGGGVMGRPWYEDGKLLNKKNTFTDFIACAEKLIADNYTNPHQLVIQGGSAGGLLMGAVTNMRPDLFQAVIAEVPFVDVVTTMLDSSIPLTVIEYDEWGNPSETESYQYIKSYSPYDNVEAKAYPHLLVTSGLNDPRVQYWEPTKWVAKLRQLKTNQHRLLLKTEMGAGHGGPSGRYQSLRQLAFIYAFTLDTLAL